VPYITDMLHDRNSAAAPPPAEERTEPVPVGAFDARKNLITVPLRERTIPHEVTAWFGASQVMLKPAVPGTGVIAGGAVRAVVELAGVKDILTKSPTHPHGIKVRLTDGQVGRVKEIVE